jgi:hypothetical protein
MKETAQTTMTEEYNQDGPRKVETENWGRHPADYDNDMPGVPEQDLEEQGTEDSGICWTRGVQSTVVEAGSETVAGHVLLLDCDESNPLEVVGLCEQLPGTSVLLESSPGSFHVWQLGVRDREQAVMDQLDIRVADDNHAGASYRRGYAVLRVDSKEHNSGAVYKEAPKIHSVYLSDPEYPQSEPHCQALCALADKQGKDSEADRLATVLISNQFQMVGDPETLLIDEYGTVTDSEKQQIRGESEGEKEVTEMIDQLHNDR